MQGVWVQAFVEEDPTCHEVWPKIQNKKQRLPGLGSYFQFFTIREKAVQSTLFFFYGLLVDRCECFSRPEVRKDCCWIIGYRHCGEV